MVNSHLLYQLSYAGNAPFRGPKRYRKRADDVNASDGPTRLWTSPPVRPPRDGSGSVLASSILAPR